MSRVQKFIVVPFRRIKGRYHPGEVRFPASEEAAIRLAELMAQRFDGVAAIEVLVDPETDEMHDPRELAVFGSAPAIDDLMVA